MTIDELKRSWDSLDMHGASDRETLAGIERRIRNRETSTLRDKISSGAMKMGVVALLAPFMLIPFWVTSKTLVILGFIFFYIVSGMQFYFSSRMKKIDYCHLTVTEAFRMTIDAERLRSRIRLVGMSLGFPYIIYLGWVFYSIGETYMLAGCVAGTIVGGAVGLLINHRFVTWFRRMKDELDDVD